MVYFLIDIVIFMMLDRLYFPIISVKPSHELLSFIDSIITSLSYPNENTSTACDFICFSCKKSVCRIHSNFTHDFVTHCNRGGCKSVPLPQCNFAYISSQVKTPRFMSFFA